MKQVILNFFAIVLPWVAMLLKDNPGAALVALALQCTVIGWIPASMWAWRVCHQPPESDIKEP